MATELLEKKNYTNTEENLGSYLQEIRRYPRLTLEQERELAAKCTAGDQEAIWKMVTSNLRLSVAVAREYAGRGVPLMDLIQEGNIGLIVAARKFDYTLDYRFSTYATKWIRQGITRCLMNHAGLIRVPVHTAERMRKLMSAKAAYVQETGHEPEGGVLAEVTGIPAEKVEKLLQLIPETCSLDAPAGEDGESTLGQLLPDKSTTQPQESLVQAQLLEIMDSLMSRLDQRQQTILRLHFGVDDGVSHSLEEISGMLGISKERTRQVERQAFSKLKTMGAELGLEDFLED